MQTRDARVAEPLVQRELRALTDRVPLVRAEGLVVHAGRQVATAEWRLVGPDGKLYAHASTSCLVFDARVPAR